jgi:hypothetical protein
MTSALLLALTLGALNFIRGRGMISHSRVTFCVLAAIASVLHTASVSSVTPLFAAALMPLFALGFYVWAVFGWGNGFMAFTGEDSRDYRENWIICRLADWCVKVNSRTQLTTEQCHAWGLAYMSIRGLYALPLFAVLAQLFSPIALVCGLLCVMQGSVYFAMRWLPWKDWRVACAEFVFGCWLGLLVGVAVAA